MMIVETDLHLNPQHPAYDQSAVQTLISAAQEYIGANMAGPASVRLVSTRSGEF
ncbi:hypothetical protein [Bradyrhizobium elkanii]|uniref:hypothetical protein n=1 Tax=Bradyrhizobium elkanii TaxID=29448 RepID=UPI001FD8AF13|nr:hypothetical protein [Bradyrhizobium elkanii]